MHGSDHWESLGHSYISRHLSPQRHRSEEQLDQVEAVITTVRLHQEHGMEGF